MSDNAPPTQQEIDEHREVLMTFNRAFGGDCEYTNQQIIEELLEPMDDTGITALQELRSFKSLAKTFKSL